MGWFNKKNLKAMGDRACPCCEKLEFSEADKYNYTICRFCGWEDEEISAPNEFSGANYMSLNRYKKRHQEFINADPDYIWERSFSRGKFKNPKKELQQEYKEILAIVKFHIDDWDCIGLLDLGCPKDEYDIEAAAIVSTAYRTNCVEELTDKIVKTFTEYFGKDTYTAPREDAKAVAEQILKDKSDMKVGDCEN
jgi:hypothetical protein